MNESNLFPLSHFSSVYKGYFFDKSLTLYSNKSGELKKIKSQRSYFNEINYPKNLHALREKTSYSKEFNEFFESNQCEQVKVVPIKRHSFLVALIEDGIPKFSSKPKVHETESSAKEEVKRLVTLNATKEFAYFECKGLAKSTGIVWF